MWRKIKTFFSNSWGQLSPKQKYFVAGLILLLIFTPIFVFALDIITTAILKILTGIISVLVSFFGKLLAVVLHVLVYVAQYNNFINEQVVVEGWKVVRDVCNMFFVLGLLIIAFGTVLRLQNYQAKNLLRSFILGAIFVNFSKTICGLILDFAQIIMLTFVNGFKDVGAGNLTEMLGLTALFDVVVNNSVDATNEPLEGLGVFISYLLALIYIIVALVVILTMAIMLIQRAVMLWIYIVLSPFPYLLSALPKAGKLGQAGSRWWSDFTGLVITGPMLAFFIWLSFFTASGSGVSNSVNEEEKKEIVFKEVIKDNEIKITGGSGQAIDPNQGSDLTDDINAGVTKSGTAQAIIKFIVSIGLLWGGMMLTKETSSLVGGVVGAGMSNLKKMGNKVKKTAGGMATTTAKWAGRNALKGAGGLTYAMSKNSNSKVGQMFQKLGTAGKTWGDELTKERKEEKTKKRLKTLKKLGLGVGDKTMAAFKEVANDDVVKTIGKTVKGGLTMAGGTAAGILTGNPFLGALMIGGSTAAGLAQSPLNKVIGGGIKRMIGGTTVPAYEDAYDRRHKTIKNAAVTMGSERLKAAEARDASKKRTEELFRNGRITRDRYQQGMDKADDIYKRKVGKAVETYKSTKAAATEQMYDEFIDIRQRNLRQKGKIAKADQEKQNYDDKVRAINSNPSLSNEMKQAALLKAKQDYAGGGSWKNIEANLPILTAWLAGGTGLKKLGQGIEDYHPFRLSADAADLYLKDSNAAQERVKQISQRTDHAALFHDLAAGDFSGGLAGITPKHKNFYEKLTNRSNPAETTAAINNLVGAVGQANPNEKKDQNIIRSMLRGIAGFEFNGGDVSRLQPLIKALNSQAAGTGGKVDQYDDYLKKAVKMRQVGPNAAVGQGDGSLRVNSFASGMHKANIIGVDFDQLKSLGDLTPDVETGKVVGANIAPEKMAAVASELTGLIDNELATLEQAGSAMVTEPLDVLEQKISQLRDQRSTALQNGNLDEASSAMEELEPLSRIRDLRVAKERLADPANLDNLSLKNTGVSLASARESHTTNIHEALHGFGLDNENLTEAIAQKMASGSYRVDDVAAAAQNIKDIMAQKNITQEQVTAADIDQAVSGVQPISQAEQVISKESGETVINNQTTINNTAIYNNQEEGDESNNDNNNDEYFDGADKNSREPKKINKLSEDIKQRQRLEDYRYFRGLNEDKNDRRRAENIEKAVKQPPKQ